MSSNGNFKHNWVEQPAAVMGTNHILGGGGGGLRQCWILFGPTDNRVIKIFLYYYDNNFK